MEDYSAPAHPYLDLRGSLRGEKEGQLGGGQKKESGGMGVRVNGEREGMKRKRSEFFLPLQEFLRAPMPVITQQ